MSVRLRQWGAVEEIQLQTKEGAELIVVSGYGCNTRKLTFVRKGRPISVLAGITSEAELSENFSNGAMLAPFTNRVKGGAYSFQGQDYQLECNYGAEGNACHGLVYNLPFTLERFWEEIDGVVALFSLTICEGSFGGYPFGFQLFKEFTLTSRSLSIATRALNTGSSPFPFADGWHPFFKLGESLDSHKLMLPANRYFSDPLRRYCSEVPPALEAQSLAGRIYDHCFFTPETDSERSTILEGPRGTVLRLWQDQHYPFLQVFTPPKRDCIALEPMSSPPFAFNHMQDVCVLEPGQEFSGLYGVSLERVGE